MPHELRDPPLSVQRGASSANEMPRVSDVARRRDPLASAHLTIAALAAVLLVVWLFVPRHPFAGVGSYLPFHMFAETFSVIVSMMIFGVMWNAYGAERSSGLLILSCAMLAAGLLDFGHMLSVSGMPRFVTASSPDKGIAFWLSARLFAAVGLLLAALLLHSPVGKPRSRYALLAIFLAITALIYWVGLFHLDSLPRFFVEGSGLTPVKIWAESLVAGILAVAAIVFYRRARRTPSAMHIGLYAAASISVLSELYFAIYTARHDLFQVLGHGYKVLAYLCIYRAVFLQCVREPFDSVLREIAERKRAEDIAARLEQAQARMRESEQRLQAIFDRAGVGIIEIEGDDRFAAVNDRVCEILGYRREELLNRTVRDLTYPEDRPLSDRLHGEVLAGLRDRIDYEKRYLKRNGSPVWVHVTSSAVRDAGGRWLRSIATIEDVTDRRKVEAALRASERRYRTFVDLTNQFAWMTNPKGEIVEDVPAFRAFTGQSHEEVKGTGWSQALHPEDLERTLEVWNRAVLTCSPYEIEYRMRRHDGAYRVLLVKGVPILDDERNVLEWVGSCVDITERKAAEKALQESELFYRQTLESIPGMVFTTRPDGYCDYQSQQWVDFTGVPMSEHLGDGWNRLLHPDDRPRAFAAWRAAVGGKAEYDLEYRVRRHDGQYEWFKVRGRPIHDAQGRIVRWFGVAANIDVLKRTETALQAATTSAERAKEAAEEANRAKDQFLAVLSHELRTPLSPVLAAVQLMQRKDGLTEDARHHLEIIRRNVQLEARLIDDLLDLTRIVQGKISLERKPVYVCTAIDRVVEICAPDIAARGLHFGVDIKERPHRVNGDISRLQQVLWNLLNNSIKFTPKGGCVGIRCYREEAHVIIEVNDSGIGIKPESISRIFNAFEQEDQRVTRQFGGLGLGLAITRRLVEMHDGTISARSPGKDKGASFRVALPVFAAEVEREAAAEAQKIPAVPKKAWSILLVEDHGDTAAMMRQVLELSGYQVENAADVAQALSAARLNHFDLLVSDLGLPDGSGLDLMKTLRQRGSTLKGIALSGYGREQDIRSSKEAGFSAHLTKPVDMDALIEAVAKAL